MIIEPSIRSNIFLNAHPLGCKQFVYDSILEAKTKKPFDGPKKVLIIGGSSGYGLASRIALAYGASSDTINISFETPPKGKRTGTAGWWNNVFFQQFAKETQHIHKDFIGDAFGKAMKKEVTTYIKERFGKLDLVIYSLAAGARMNEEKNELIKSSIKAIGEDAVGKTIDLADLTVKELIIGTATEQEIDDTVYVMGGSAWKDWIDTLVEADLVNPGFKTISYTYIGGPTTDKIYRGGTLGKAKEDLEMQARIMNEELHKKYQGEALISSSKAVVTKASVFIPQMPVYVSCLFDVMTRHGIHESTLSHKYRLFQDMIYGDKRIIDNENRIRLDHQEMIESIQKETIHMMQTLSDQELFELKGTKMFIKEFHQIHGFEYDSIDYTKDIDLDQLATLLPE
ncbi:MAG: enoyl-ACP reductase FabV [Acholeplasmataceae bacterium]|jgi:enoyl-[acyl-carrier protein] reductase/trans-2-enoyl-CoA reductase (NAD+)|nr:enoyl-[acyl-carrier-protein] reductase FabV [Acholeplasmataceae bacterium]